MCARRSATTASWVSASAARPASAPISPTEEQLLEALAAHLARAAEISRRMDLFDVQAKATASVLDILRAGILLVGSDRRIAYANTAAERLLRAGDGLCTVQGRPRATAMDVHARLVPAIHDATRAANDHRQGGATLAVPRAQASGPLSLSVTPLDERDHPALGAGLLAMILVAAPEQSRAQPGGSARCLRSHACRSAARRRSLAGQSLSDHASATGTSLNTVKYHLKSVFGKTGDARQPDLVRCLLSDPVLRMNG